MRRLFIGLFILLSFTSTAVAGWLDQWFDQYTSTAPNYFEGQKRGYFTAGSFSARIPSSTDFLISIEKPRVQAGCGGIDMFLGGFGFTNFDYLVQKFQRLIQAAPVIAFQIALNTLSAQLSEEMKDAEKIIDLLNSIQINECAIMKPFTTIKYDPKTGFGDQFERAARAAIKSMGLGSLLPDFEAHGSEILPKTGSIDARKQWEGCSIPLQELYEIGKNSLVGYMTSQGGYPSGLADIIRGTVGDVVIVTEGSVPYVDLKPSCPENIYQSLKDGKLYKRSSPSSECVEDSTNALRERVASILETAYNVAKAGGTGVLPSDFQKIVKSSPVPVQMLLRYAAVTEDRTVLYNAADPIAKGLLYQAFLDIARDTKRIIDGLVERALMTNKSDDPESLCQVSDLQVSLMEFSERLTKAFQAVSSIYQESIGEMQKSLEIASLYRDFESKVFALLAEKVGRTVAQRVLSR